jgi:hypothetical protein
MQHIAARSLFNKMKTFASLIVALLFTATLSACTSGADQPIDNSFNSSPAVSASASSSSPISSTTLAATSDIELFTMDELFNQGGGGCGMTLWKQDDGLRPPGYLFYNRLAQRAGDEFTLMKVDGEFVRFRRTAAVGQEFYGQQTSQTFVSQDETIQLQVDVTLGQPGEIESFAVEGTMQVQHSGQTVEISVRGSAGC